MTAPAHAPARPPAAACLISGRARDGAESASAINPLILGARLAVAVLAHGGAQRDEVLLHPRQHVVQLLRLLGADAVEEIDAEPCLRRVHALEEVDCPGRQEDAPHPPASSRSIRPPSVTLPRSRMFASWVCVMPSLRDR